MRKDIDIKEFLNNEGHLNDAAVLLYVDGLKLGRQSDLPEALLNYVSECPECREQVFDYYEFTEEEPVASPHPYFDVDTTKTVTIGWTPLAIAAAITLLIVIGMLFLLTDQENNGRKPIPIVETDSTNLPANKPADNVVLKLDTTSKVAIPEKVLKEVENGVIKNEQPREQPKANTAPLLAYQRVASLDRRIDKNSTSRGLTITSPTVDAVYKSNIPFQWGAPTKSALIIEVFTAATVQTPIRIEIPKGETGYTYTESLEANLYYWKVFEKIGNRKKQVGLGRFTVGD